MGERVVPTSIPSTMGTHDLQELRLQRQQRRERRLRALQQQQIQISQYLELEDIGNMVTRIDAVGCFRGHRNVRTVKV